MLKYQLVKRVRLMQIVVGGIFFLSISLLFGEVKVMRNDNSITLENEIVELKLDLKRNQINYIGFKEDTTSLIEGIFLYCSINPGKKDKYCPNYDERFSKKPPAKFKIVDEGKGKKIIVTQNFPCFNLRKEIGLQESSPEIFLSYQILFKKPLGVSEPHIFFIFPQSQNVLSWETGEIKGEELGDCWKGDVNLRDSPWIAVLNPKTNKGLLIIRDYNVGESEYRAGKVWPYLSHRIVGYKGITIYFRQQLSTEKGYPLSRWSYRLIPFKDQKPKDVFLNAEKKRYLPSTCYSLVKEIKIAPVKLCSSPPKIDGILEKDFWGESPVASDFYLYRFEGSGKKLLEEAREKTEVYLAYDENNLYLGFCCFESDIENIKAEQKTGSSSLYHDDCVEIFLAPENPSSYFHFIVNPKGAKQDNLGNPNEWQAVSKINKDNWTSEIAIPFSFLGKKPKDNEIWKVNFCREERPHLELSTWSYLSGQKGFHQPSKFSELIFNPVISPVIISTWESDLRNEVLVFTKIKNFKEKKISCSLNCNLFLPSGEAKSKTKEVLLKNGEEKLFYFSFPIETQKGYTLSLEVKDPNLGFPYYLTRIEKIGFQGLVSRIFPMEWGKVRYFACNSVQPITFLLANYTEKTQPFRFVIELPKEIKLLYPERKSLTRGLEFPLTDFKEEPITINNRNYHRYTLTFHRPLPPRKLEDIKLWQSLTIPFAVGKVPYDSFPFYFYLEGVKGKLIEKKNKVTVKVLPQFEGKSPKKIETGIYSYYLSNLAYAVPIDKVEEATKSIAETWKKAGINLVIRADQQGTKEIDQKILKALRATGIKNIRVNFWWFWWGEKYLKDHPDAQAITFEGKKAKVGDKPAICPMVLINKEEAFTEAKRHIHYLIKYAGPDGFMRNLEAPGCFHICFCKRCLEAFRKYMGISSSEKLTPVILKTKYRDKWISFCCWQQAQIEKMIRKAIKEVNPEGKLAPYSGKYDEERNRVRWEYMTKYKSIDIAGPSWYEITPGFLNNWEREIEKFRKRVNYMPVNAWLASFKEQKDHRLLRLQTIKIIADGFQGYTFYYGVTLDGIRFHDLAAANTIISDFEDFFFKGKRDKNLVKSEKPEKGFSFAPWVLDKERVVFIFNYNPKKKKIISLKNLNLPSGVIGWDYMKNKLLKNPEKIQITLSPLGVGILYFGPEKELQRRRKTWGGTYQWID